MRLVAAGSVLLLAIIVGVISHITIPCFILDESEEENENINKCNTLSVAAIASFFEKSNWKQWLFVIVPSILCAIAGYLMYNSEIAFIDFLRYIIVAMLLLSAMIIDKHTHLIPNILVIFLGGLGVALLLVEFLLYRETFTSTLLLNIVGLLCCIVLFYVMARLTKDGIGMGDVKIIAAMGWVLGLSTALTAVLFALIICTVVAIFLLLGKKKNKNDSLPFGPFLFLGYIFMLILVSI